MSKSFGLPHRYLYNTISTDKYSYRLHETLHKAIHVLQKEFYELTVNNCFDIDNLVGIGALAYIKKSMSTVRKSISQYRVNYYVETVVNSSDSAKENVKDSMLNLMNKTDYFIYVNRVKL